MPAAAIIPAAIGAAGAIGGSIISANGARSAANQQAEANQSQLAEQQYQFDTVRGLLKPYVDTGTQALGDYQTALGGYRGILGNLLDLTGGNGNVAQQASIKGLQSNPLYTNAMNLGQQAILANASATGGLRNGNTIYNLGYLPGQVLSNVMQSQIGNLGTALTGQQGLLGNIGGLISLGENAAAGTGNAAMQTGNNVTSLLGQQGAIGAGATLAGTNALTNGLNGVTGALGSYFGSGGGGGGFNFTMPAGSAATPAYMSAAGMSPAGLFGVGSGMGAGG
jgi:hypothetical protein